MSVYKEMKKGEWTGKWIAYCYYTDWQGNRKPKMKRGFATKKDGLEWEREFIQISSKDIDMAFSAFVEIYLKDKKARLKHNTYLTKKHIIEHKILPYFGKLKLNRIKAADIIQWQNTLLEFRDKDGNAYAETYMRTVANQLNAIFNHAVRYYELPKNPVLLAGKMGRSKGKEMLFWTKEEYLDFVQAIDDKPISFYAFEVLYWSGCRLGELLALTSKDIDFQNQRLIINKSYQRLGGKDYITTPKTEKSNRIIQIPEFLCNELKDYLKILYGCKQNDRIFQITKSYLHHEMKRGCEISGVKKIRIHDLRHSHVALLIEMGFSPVAIAERLGHESIVITFQYAHLYPSKQLELAKKLDNLHNERSE